MREQIAFRPPAGTKARMEALRRPGDTLLDVLLRAVNHLEQSQAPAEAPDKRLDRLDILEAGLAELRGEVAKLAPKPAARPKATQRAQEPGRWTRMIEDNPGLIEDI